MREAEGSAPAPLSPLRTPILPLHRPSSSKQFPSSTAPGGLGPCSAHRQPARLGEPSPLSHIIHHRRIPCPHGPHTLILAQASCVDSVPRRSLINMEPKYCLKEGEMLKASDRKPAYPKVMPQPHEQPAAVAGEGQVTWGRTGSMTTPPATP